MNEIAKVPQGTVEAFPAALPSTVIIDELSRLMEMVQGELPEAVRVQFEFDGKLRVHIDVRKAEEVALVEARLPHLQGGIFMDARHGRTPGHAFLHRVSALVVR